MLNLFAPLIFHTGHKMDCLSITFGPTQLHICKSSHSFWQILVLRAPNWPQTAELKRKIDFPLFFSALGSSIKNVVNKRKRGQKLANTFRLILRSKLYIPSTPNIELILWPTKIDCVCSKMLNHGLNHGLFLLLFILTYALHHTLNCTCVSLFES